MEELMKKLDENLKIINYEYVDDKLVIKLESSNKTGICPCCGKCSNNVHSK